MLPSQRNFLFGVSLAPPFCRGAECAHSGGTEGSRGTTFPQLALCRGNSMTETRQLVAGSLRFEDEDAVTAVPRRATQDPTATRTNADAHFVPEDLLERECLGTWGQRFLYQ